MKKPISVEPLANEIRALFKEDPLGSERRIGKHVEERLEEFLPAERLTLLKNLMGQFETSQSGMTRNLNLEGEGFSKLFVLLLGKRASGMDLSSPELPERLALSLNTIFDTLNQIVEVIQGNLFGRKVELETIRQILSSRLEAEDGSDSLQDYLNQIQEAFLVAHRAFQKAAQTKIREILAELNPERIEAEAGGSKFGPLRKASLYEIYKEKYRACSSWFESGRLMEDLLKEFERVCQKQYQVEIGGEQ